MGKECLDIAIDFVSPVEQGRFPQLLCQMRFIDGQGNRHLRGCALYLPQDFHLLRCEPLEAIDPDMGALEEGIMPDFPGQQSHRIICRAEVVCQKGLIRFIEPGNIFQLVRQGRAGDGFSRLAQGFRRNAERPAFP